MKTKDKRYTTLSLKAVMENIRKSLLVSTFKVTADGLPVFEPGHRHTQTLSNKLETK